MSLERIEEAIEKVAVLPATVIGAAIGAARNKDKGESRGDAIGRSARTGFATDLGMLGGSAVGLGVRKLLKGHEIERPLGKGFQLATTAAGGLAAYLANKRTPPKKKEK